MAKLLTLVVLVIAASAVGAPPGTLPSHDLQGWWADLQEGEPKASRALLNFSSIPPEECVAFMKKRLRPLKLETDDLNVLLSVLGSDKESEWKPAFEQLEYFDPRLAMDLQALMDGVTDYPARSRLVEILCDYPAGTFKGKKIELRHFCNEPELSYNFFADKSSWWAENKVERLGSTSWGKGKKKWERAVRAIVLLKHIGTPGAISIVQDMTTGHPEAMPTKLAKETLAGK